MPKSPVSTEYPRRGRGAAATRLHGISPRNNTRRYGAFPSATTWYVSGGYVTPAAGVDPIFKATIMKTEDGGSFATVYNNSAHEADPGGAVRDRAERVPLVRGDAADATWIFRGGDGSQVGGMGAIDCVDEQLCYAVSNCDQTECAETNKSSGYGSYIHRTKDGGKTWDVVHFEYEATMMAIAAVSATNIHVVGGGMGITGGAAHWFHSSDGETFDTTVANPTGFFADISMLPGGKAGFAAWCTFSNSCALYRYGA